MQEEVKQSGVLTWSLLALLAAAILYKLAVPAPGDGTAASASAPAGARQAPSREGGVPPIAPSLSTTPAVPAPSPRASDASAGAFFGQPLTTWYQQALRPTATVHDRTVATRLSVLCATVLSQQQALAESQGARSRALPASVAGVSATELAAWHASRWLVREVLGKRPEVALFERTQCAVYGFCSSAITLSDAERQKADAAARRVLSDLQRQDWPRLILKSGRAEG